MLYTINQQIKPNVRQVVEDTLAENANIVAQLVAEDVFSAYVNTPEFNKKIQNALSRDLDAKIWQQNKNQIHQQLYITDAQGIVLYDSQGLATGQDYSKWNDVYLTLRGRYGARSTRQDETDPNSSTMFIAAPIIHEQQLIGVVSLGKPNISVQPYIDRAERYFLQHALWVAFVSLFLSSIVAWWLRRSIDKVRHYAQSLAPLDQAPHFYSAKELNLVTQAITEMREKLEDRAYVEQYVNTLTHELKSPLTAIQASAEILKDQIPYSDQQQFAQHIELQSYRLRDLIDRMLILARLEQTPHQFESHQLDLISLIHELLDAQKSKLQQKRIRLNVIHTTESITIQSDLFWLKHAINNLIDNAVDFCDTDGLLFIRITEHPFDIRLEILNTGDTIPDFAISHIFERYYSLPRPITKQRSSGIGLTIVKQVIDGLGGQININNVSSSHCIDWLPTDMTGVHVVIIIPIK